ncbi:protease modulator HflC [Oceaniglobus roseus]|uniref:protease modulator HflC n=1 Tax=Oceaniglobus roseus TaxID=1737570 RepID=UPI000C7E96D9|nr:protease modulator HflC [Kandeliimicrobium roseum]
MKKSAFILPVAVVLGAVALSSVFIVDEREKALVLQFGQIKAVKEEPGLAFKIPFIQDVVYYDDRILSLDTDPIEVTPSDDRRLVVDAFARYRIADVVQFRQAVGVGGERAAEDRLAGIINPQIRAVLGSDGVTSNTILSSDRATLMARITQQARTRAAPLGLEVLDVRLKQTALPEQNLDATFARMRAEREREAADEIARGEEAAQRVRAQADRTVVELVSEATRDAEVTRGEADAERNRIFAEAFGKDEEFFEFYRSLTAYQRSLQGQNSTMVMSPDGEFFEYLRSTQPRGTAAPSGDGAAAQPQGGTATPAPDSGGSASAAPSGSAPAVDDTAAGDAAEPADDQAASAAPGSDATGAADGGAATPETADASAAPAAPANP